MSDAISLHVLCRYEGISPKGLRRLEAGVYESVSWRVKQAQFLGLIGKTFCMHESKSKPSYLGGEILEIRQEAIPHNDGELRAIVKFRVVPEDRDGIKWPPTSNPNEYCHVNTSVPLEKLRKA